MDLLKFESLLENSSLYIATDFAFKKSLGKRYEKDNNNASSFVKTDLMILSLPRIIVNHLISKDNTKKEESIILPFSVMTELEDSDMKQQVEVGKFNVLGKRIIKAYFDPVNVCLNVDNLEHYLSTHRQNHLNPH